MELDTTRPFLSVPRRVFLDSSVLQTMINYGEFIWENVEPELGDRIYSVPGGIGELEALRLIAFVGQRAQFELALSANSLSEVAAARRVPGYMNWAHEMLNYCETWLDSYDGAAFTGVGKHLARSLDDSSFGYLSTKDRQLLQDAVVLECDAFLTMERKLPKHAEHLRRKVGLWVMRPTTWWDKLEPWTRIWV